MLKAASDFWTDLDCLVAPIIINLGMILGEEETI